MGFIRKLLVLCAPLAVGITVLGAVRSAQIPAPAAIHPIQAGSPAGIARGLVQIRYADRAHFATPAAHPTPVAAKPPPPPPVVACAPKSIDVNLTTQELVATECGRVFLSTPITSGRPGLRTPTGSFAIFLKEQDVFFYSPWPQGDPNYYPPMFVAYAMEFLTGEFYLHTDPDEPASAFGPGSQNGPYASHGCVHVPTDVMARIYAWADNGTSVTTHY